MNVRIVNTTTGQVSAQIGADTLGARLRFPPGNAAYQVEVQHSGTASIQGYSICLSYVSVGGCESASAVQPTVAPPPPAATEELTGCTISPAVNGVNIRQSASTNSIILGTLPSGVSLSPIGIDPTRSFYNIQYENINGWVALSVINSSGDCSTLLTVNPPPIQQIPTQQPTLPPPPPPTASTPCLITITSPAYVYTQHSTSSDLFDQVQAGAQLTPIARLADNSWWKTNYYNSWIQTSLFGSAANVSGDCSVLPVVSP